MSDTPTNQTLRQLIETIIWDAYHVGFDNGQDSREPLHEEQKVDAILATLDTFIASVTEKAPGTKGYEEWDSGYLSGYNQAKQELLEAYKQFRGNDD